MNLTRRQFLAGCLVVGFSLSCTRSRSRAAPSRSLSRYPEVDSWLAVLEDGRVQVFTGKLELGQGITIAIAQVAAEELGLTPDQVEVVLADTERTPNEGYSSGSRSVEDSATAVRYAAATAREHLVSLARKRGGDVEVAGGKVGPWTFAELLEGRLIRDRVRPGVQFATTRRVMGQPVPRPDIERMVAGEAVYVQDLRFPGMLHARVVRPPGYGARLESLNTELDVLRDGSFLAVVREDEWEAIKACERVRRAAGWTPVTPVPEVDAEFIKSLPVSSQAVFEQGHLGETEFQAEYFKPYIMHGSIGPSCAVALYEDGRLTVWTHSQGVYPLRDTLRAMLGIEDIHVIGVPGSGCYGHNGADDAAADAALIATKRPGRHVRVQWSRSDEHTWEPYGSAMLVQVRAGVVKGKITSWDSQVWSDAHGTRPRGDPGVLLAARLLERPFQAGSGGYRGGTRNAIPMYAIPNVRVVSHSFEGPLRVSALRSLGAFANVVAIECTMEALAGKNPLDFRIDHLEDSRAVAVLEELGRLTAGRKGLGYGFSRYKNEACYCGVAARVADGRLAELWAVADAGEVINSDGLANQIEGGMIQAASWTLKEQVGPRRSDWADYPILGFTEAPEVHVSLIDRPGEPFLGAGEAAAGPAGAAILNAFSLAVGERLTTLPLRRS